MSTLPTASAQQQISILHEIGQILGSTTKFEEALNVILKLMCDQLDMSLGTVSLLSQEASEVSIDVAYGLSQSEIKRGRYDVGEGITGKVVESGKPVIVPRISSEPLFLNRTGARGSSAKSQTSFICVPILQQQQVVGTISVDIPYKDNESLQDTVRLLSIISVMIGQSVAARQRARAEQTQLLDENLRLQNELRERFHPRQPHWQFPPHAGGLPAHRPSGSQRRHGPVARRQRTHREGTGRRCHTLQQLTRRQTLCQSARRRPARNLGRIRTIRPTSAALTPGPRRAKPAGLNERAAGRSSLTKSANSA